MIAEGGAIYAISAMADCNEWASVTEMGLDVMAMRTGKGAFPTTDWGLFANVRDGSPAMKMATLDILIRRYWKPVFLFLKYSGANEESAKDSTQAFFADWIENDVFSKADEREGRFRSFMLSCLKRFVANEHRAACAKKRQPEAGLLSLDELMADTEMPFQPADGMTPEMIFERTWASEVVQRVLQHLERECIQKGQEIHYALFARRIINPILHGETAPSWEELGKEYDMTQKQAANHLETVKRAYRKLMEEEIRLYAASEAEVAEEVRAIFRILGQ